MGPLLIFNSKPKRIEAKIGPDHQRRNFREPRFDDQYVGYLGYQLQKSSFKILIPSHSVKCLSKGLNMRKHKIFQSGSISPRNEGTACNT